MERRRIDVSSMAWGERWTFVSRANSYVGTQSCPTSPGRSAERSDPTHPWYVRVLDSTGSLLVPGHALREKSLQKIIGAGTLLSSQERRALAVPLINRWSTADFVPPTVYMGFLLFVLSTKRPGQCLRFAGGKEGG